MENLNLQQEGDKWTQDPDEVAQQIVAHNKKHFSQAKSCYFSRKEFQQVVDPTSDAFDTSIMKPLESDFLQELQKHNATPISAVITPEDWRNKFKSWSESTRTSPSRLHLGHFKSLLSTIYNISHMTADLTGCHTQHGKHHNSHRKTANKMEDSRKHCHSQEKGSAYSAEFTKYPHI